MKIELKVPVLTPRCLVVTNRLSFSYGGSFDHWAIIIKGLKKMKKKTAQEYIYIVVSMTVLICTGKNIIALVYQHYYSGTGILLFAEL